MSDKDIFREHVKELFELRIEELANRLEIPQEMAASYIVVKIMLETEAIVWDK